MIKKIISIFCFLFLLLNIVGCTKKYTVTFKDYDGSLLKEVIVRKGNDAEAPKDPSRDGYLFTGWSESYTDIKDNKIIVAQYEKVKEEIKKYTVSFVTNSDTLIEEQYVEKGDRIIEPIKPIKDGYTFDGWYIGDEKWSFVGYSVIKNITLEAKWQLNTYNITYDLNGGTLSESNPTTYTVEDEFTLNKPEKENYTFVGWTSNKIKNPVLNLKICNEISDKYFVANYEPNMYTIKFDTNGGNKIKDIKFPFYETNIGLPIPTKEGHKFLGWYENEQLVDSIDSRNYNLVAKWISQNELNVQAVLDSIFFDETLLAELKWNLTLVKKNGKYPDVKIEWSSSETDLIDADGTVTRPALDDPRAVDGKVEVTLTVTASQGEAKGSKTFKAYVLGEKRINVATIKNIIDSFYTIMQENNVVFNGKTKDYAINATITGEVLIVLGTKGFFISDGTGLIYVYSANPTVKVGDVVTVNAGVYAYYGACQFGSNVSYEAVADQDFADLTFEQTTIDDYTEELDSARDNAGLIVDLNKMAKYSGYGVELYAKVGKGNQGTNDTYYLEDPYTGEKVALYYYTTADYETQFDALVGKYVNIKVFTYDYYIANSMYRVLYCGQAITEAAAPDLGDSVVLTSADLFAGCTGTAYAGYNGEHTLDGVTYKTNQAMIAQGASATGVEGYFQLQAEKGTIANTTAYAKAVKTIVITFWNTYDTPNMPTLKAGATADSLTEVTANLSAGTLTGVKNASGYEYYEYTITYTLPEGCYFWEIASATKGIKYFVEIVLGF